MTTAQVNNKRKLNSLEKTIVCIVLTPLAFGSLLVVYHVATTSTESYQQEREGYNQLRDLQNSLSTMEDSQRQ